MRGFAKGSREKLKKFTSIEVIENEAFVTAEKCFNSFNNQEKGRYLLVASFAVNFLIDIEPRLSNDIGKNDVLQLEILTDYQGQLGDVRDVLIIRSLQKWEIGISAKNNHKAVKHSRLSNDIDFGEKWLGLKCSQGYFDEIDKVFAPLKEIKERSNSTQTWSTIKNKEDTIYLPILNSFKKELLRIHESHSILAANRLIEYLVGNKDYYKVIKSNNSLEIQAYNLYGTLNLPFKDIEPKFKTPRIEFPNQILDIYFKTNSKTTIFVKLNNEWELSFRIHNASSRIEPSLKFDINLIKAPSCLFINKLSIPTGV